MTTCSMIQQYASRLYNQKPFDWVNERNLNKAFRAVEKISVVALGILAAFTAPELFIPSFALGALIGLCTAKQMPRRHHHHTIEGGGCSHGFLEERLGVKLPDSLSLLAGTAVMAVHIDHHAEVFVPIVGLTLGIWAGNLAAPSFTACKRAFSRFEW
jgi:hypothetical protein